MRSAWNQPTKPIASQRKARYFPLLQAKSLVPGATYRTFHASERPSNVEGANPKTDVRIAGIAALTCSLACAVRMLWPVEYISLRTPYIRRFTTWDTILRSPADVRDDTMKNLVEVIAGERSVNDRKTQWLRLSLALLVAGLTLISTAGVILGIERVRW